MAASVPTQLQRTRIRNTWRRDVYAGIMSSGSRVEPGPIIHVGRACQFALTERSIKERTATFGE